MSTTTETTRSKKRLFYVVARVYWRTKKGMMSGVLSMNLVATTANGAARIYARSLPDDAIEFEDLTASRR